MRRFPRAVVPIIVALFSCSISAAHAADSAETAGIERVLFVGTLDADCFGDTVMGWRTPGGSGGYLPSRIIWGQPRRDRFGRLDTACSVRTPFARRRRETRFVYPGLDLSRTDDLTGKLAGWRVRGGSVAFQRLNGDTLPDIILHLRGVVIERGDGRALIERDSLRSLALFAQRGLDSLPLIAVTGIGRFQSTPFFAMDLSVGEELKDPARRDLSGRTSFILEPVDLVLDEADTTGGMPAPPTAGLDGAATPPRAALRVHPNPAGDAVTIEASGLADGIYHLRLVAADGTEHLRRELHAQSRGGHMGGTLHATLDVKSLPSGYYVLRIEDNAGAPVATDHVIITQ